MKVDQEAQNAGHGPVVEHVLALEGGVAGLDV